MPSFESTHSFRKKESYVHSFGSEWHLVTSSQVANHTVCLLSNTLYLILTAHNGTCY